MLNYLYLTHLYLETQGVDNMEEYRPPKLLDLGFGFEKMFPTFSTAYFPVSVLRHATDYIPEIGARQKIYFSLFTAL